MWEMQMNDEEKIIIICTRTADAKSPYVLSVVEHCYLCGSEVWLAKSFLTSLRKDFRVVCVKCSPARDIHSIEDLRKSDFKFHLYNGQAEELQERGYDDLIQEVKNIINSKNN
jgi:recombinational DNA repair protein RecR